MANTPSNIDTSVTVPFGSQSGDGLPAPGKKWVLEASNRPPIIPKADEIGPVARYWRVHPTDEEIKFETTSGSVNQTNTKLRKRAYEIIEFNGTNRYVELHYPAPTDVMYMIYGRLLPLHPEQSEDSDITLVYDSTRNIILASRLCYGLVKVQYFAPYDLWIAVFGYTKGPPTPPILIDPLHPENFDPDDDTPPGPLDPMMIFAKYKNPPEDVDPDFIVTTLRLDPPSGDKQSEANDQTQHAMLGADKEMPRLRLEISPDEPVRLLNTSTSDKPEAGCTIWCIPDKPTQHRETAGKIINEGSIAGKNITETVVFSNSPSSTLRYQPVNRPGVRVVGSFINKWGKSFTPRVMYPGDSVHIVDWEDENTPKNSRDRQVVVDEIVIADAFGNAVPCYGILEVEYSFTVHTYQYVFDYDDTEAAFKPAWMIAYAGMWSDQSATLQLTPPNLKAVKA